MLNKVKINLIVTIIISLVMGLILGMFLSKNGVKVFPSPKFTPLPDQILTNSSLTAVHAQAEGTVSNITGDSMEIEKDGQVMTAYFEEKAGLTSKTVLPFATQSASLSKAVKIGDKVKGEVSIIINPTEYTGLSANRKQGDIIAREFTVIR